MSFLLISFIYLLGLKLIQAHVLTNVDAIVAEATPMQKQDPSKKNRLVRKQEEVELQVASQGLGPKRILAVAAMFGGRDNLGSHSSLTESQIGSYDFDNSESFPKLPEGVDGIIYSDSSAIKVDPGAAWQIVRTPYHTLGSDSLSEAILQASKGFKHSWANVSGTTREGVMAARFYKLNAYALPEAEGYDVLVWIDAHAFGASLEHHCDLPLAERLLTSLGESDMMMGKHPDRVRVADEVPMAGSRCAKTQSYDGCRQDAIAAWVHEKAQGFKDDVGLFWSGFFAYRRDATVVHDFLRQWWVEIQSFSFRDQLSFPYIVDKFKDRLKLKALEFEDAVALDAGMSCAPFATIKKFAGR